MKLAVNSVNFIFFKTFLLSILVRKEVKLWEAERGKIDMGSMPAGRD